MRIRSHRSAAIAVSAVLIGTAALTGCSAGGGGSSADVSASPSGPVTMWVRAATAAQSQPLVDAYNASHKNKVELTVVPTDNYLQKVGVAAGARQLPCLMSSDSVYMPNFISKNLYLDLTSRVDALGYKSKLAKGLMKLATNDGKIYGVPHIVSVSAIFQNDVLLQKAGIDPSKKISSLEELASDAGKVAALGSDISGLYFTGNNAGSISFTHFPAIWASGGQALSKDGTKSLLDSSISAKVFSIFDQMYKSGAVPKTVPSESGATRNDVFATGKVGYMMASNSVLQTVPENASLKIGVQAIPGVGGGQSAYVGGDDIGITAGCQNVNAAWDFLQWSLSSKGQVDVFAKMHQLTVRSDFADNKYTKTDPRAVEMNKLVGIGDTPYSLNYGQTFNDPNGPALTVMRNALFGDDAAAALKSGNASITASLAGN